VNKGGVSTVLRFNTKRLNRWLFLAGAGLVFAMLNTPALSAEQAAESNSQESVTKFNAGPLGYITVLDSGVSESGESSTPIPLVLNATGNGFDFDLGGSETRKLHLLIDSPLSPNAIGLGLDTQALSMPGRNVLGLDATLDLPLSPSLSFTGNIRQHQEQVNFQSLGNIQCTDGILRPDSYTASGCRFIDDSYAGLEQGVFSLGARYNTQTTSTELSWFTRNSGMSTAGTNRFNNIQPGSNRGVDLLTPVMTNPLLPATPLRQPLSYFDGQASGVDLSFQLGLTTDGYGDVRFGLAFSRVLDANFSGLYSNLTPVGWTISDDYDTARMDVEWSRGSFSGGIQGFYRDQVDFLNRQSLDSLTTFDVHFTWRTPWNADLSVGASNILNSGSDEAGGNEGQPTDPFESIYGRIPYVRYKQDL
jgi:hypothetical protein